LFLLILFVLLIEHEIERRKCSTIRAVTVMYRTHGGVASERTKNNGRATR
jgi:hypothetical protein